MKSLLSGKTAVVTGASKGMGPATAELFAQEGASVMLTDQANAILYFASGLSRAVTGRVLVVDNGAYIGA
ncbi:SDR family NAD(P)-dependent oxidoreductase [Burkholderia sp. WSM2230]|uniref:SDR family NAD(P)-dependent oxidoreductase n=1 Tax=Burkholderia sp. WSM2230 TaxID=944435 RepID=UPI000427B55D|nr:SDR family NAD(P)-dependent oxidoreductase [Burkholderia sp. WSM2230]